MSQRSVKEGKTTFHEVFFNSRKKIGKGHSKSKEFWCTCMESSTQVCIHTHAHTHVHQSVLQPWRHLVFNRRPGLGGRLSVFLNHTLLSLGPPDGVAGDEEATSSHCQLGPWAGLPPKS